VVAISADEQGDVSVFAEREFNWGLEAVAQGVEIRRLPLQNAIIDVIESCISCRIGVEG
jgi:hypothetical protein